MAWRLLTAALCVVLVTQRSFVDSAPASPNNKDSSNENKQSEDGSVQELEDLKHSLGKTIELMKTHSVEYASEGNGHKNMHENIKEQVSTDGKPVASVSHQVDTVFPTGGEHPQSHVRTEVDVPSRGIHRVSQHQLNAVADSAREPQLSITDNGNRRGVLPAGLGGMQGALGGLGMGGLQVDVNQELANSMNKYNPYSGVQYSPLDMAEYVFWTGDEKGVTMAIEEFLQEGMMSREEAITFLQEIKFNLDYLQTHYTQQGLYGQDHTKDRPNTIHKYMRINKPQLGNSNEEIPRQQFDLSDLRQDISKKNILSAEDSQDLLKERPEDEEDYEELLEKLRVADFLYTEYSLEEVIYQLSKIMFTQSLTRGSAEAQSALQKFTNFLETEAEEGHISRALEKKVLDVLIAALTDTLTEHPELVPAAREGLGGGAPNLPDGNRLLRKLFEMNSLDKAAIKAALATNNVATHNNQMNQMKQLNQMKQMKQAQETDAKLTPLGFGKYKTP